MGFSYGWFRMILKCLWESFPHFVLGFCVIFGENRKKGKTKNLGKHGPLRRSEGHPRRGEVLRYNEGLPHHGQAEGPEKAPPRVRQGIALLH